MELVIRGAVTTTGLCHQTSPDGKGAQMTTTVMTSAGLVRGVPYVTANSVRGLLRREAADVVMGCLLAKKQKISRNLYLSLVRGSFARTGLAAGGASYTQQAEAASNVFSGLFGGGAFMFRSPLRLERDLVPITSAIAPTLPASVRPLAIEAKPADLMVDALMAPRDDFARLPQGARDVVANLDEAYTEHMATKVSQSANQKAAKDAGESASKDDLDNFAISQCIIPGVPLFLGIRATGISQAQVGLTLEALCRWVNRNALGGGSVRGRGGFTPSLSLWLDGELITSSLFVGDAPTATLASDERIESALAAMVSALDVDASPDALERVYPSDLAEKPEKAKKGKAKAAAATTAPAAEAEAT